MPQYTLGHSDAEQERLQRQASYVGAVTRHIWTMAGLAPGMRVLDAGCGVGDTTFLAAEMVGPGGEVTGIDRSPDAVATARRRAEERGVPNVRFVAGDLGELPAGFGPFDAVVGRYVLVHQPDIPAALRGLAALVRPGGLVAFHEVELRMSAFSEPVNPLGAQVYGWLRDAFEAGGARMRVVSNLTRYFHEAGLGWASTEICPLVSCGADGFGPGYVIDTLRILAPVLERAGVVTAAEIGFETLEARYREGSANGAPALVQVNGGGWVRVGA